MERKEFDSLADLKGDVVVESANDYPIEEADRRYRR